MISGLGIIVIASLLGSFGYLVRDNGLIGLASSIGVIGIVLLVHGVGLREERLTSLQSILSILIDASTLVLEDLDLLNSKICVVSKNSNARLILTKSTCDHDASPGIGFSGGSPYISIPINDFVKNFETVAEFSKEALEAVLRDSLINEYGLCRDLDIEVSGDLVKIRLINLLQNPLKKYINRPIDPYVILTMISLAKAVSNSSVQLINRSYENSDLEIRVRVIRNA